jgi:hypothetical protein
LCPQHCDDHTFRTYRVLLRESETPIGRPGVMGIGEVGIAYPCAH